MDNLINALDTLLDQSGRYRVLEGDHDTIYLVDQVTNQHFAIHVSECN